MDRRTFLFGLYGLGTAAAGAAALGPLLTQRAEATPLDVLKDVPAPEPTESDDVYGEAPDGTTRRQHLLGLAKRTPVTGLRRAAVASAAASGRVGVGARSAGRRLTRRRRPREA